MTFFVSSLGLTLEYDVQCLSVPAAERENVIVRVTGTGIESVISLKTCVFDDPSFCSCVEAEATVMTL